MGFFDVRKKKTTTVRIDGVLPWIENTLAELDTNDSIMKFLQELENKKLALFSSLTKLEEKVGAQKYSESIRTFFMQRSPPKKRFELYYYAQETSSALEALKENLQKEFYQYKETAPADIILTQQKLLEIEQLIVGIVAHFEKLKIEKYEQLKKSVDEYSAKKEKIAKLKERLPIEEAKKAEPLSRLEKIQQRKEKLRTTRSYLVYDDFRKQKELLEAEMNKHLEAYLTSMTVLKEALEQFMDIDDRKKVIQDYLTQPAQALATDSSLVILDILKDLKKIVNGEALEATKMHKDDLKEYQVHIRSQNEELKKLEERLGKDSIRMMVNEQENYERSVQETIDDIDKSIAMINDEIDRTSLQLAWQKVRDAFKTVDINVVLEPL